MRILGVELVASNDRNSKVIFQIAQTNCAKSLGRVAVPPAPPRVGRGRRWWLTMEEKVEGVTSLSGLLVCLKGWIEHDPGGNPDT